MTDIAIRASHLSKCYHIYNHPQDRLKQFFMPRLQRLCWRPPKQYFHEFWALNDISFEIKKGETVGILGRNGSGKSTLLQLLCGTLTPSSGEVDINGRVAALLELGSGFNPDFTGRENVYLSASVLGLSDQEIKARFDEIVAFADIGEFIEQPVKTYSSGMFIRLAFAVNVLSDPDIMIVDEALAVGDMNFQAKCMSALKRIQERGTTILFVSHDIGSVKSLCSRGIYLDRGQVKQIGKASEVAEHYMRVMREEMNAMNQPLLPETTNANENLSVADQQLFKHSEDFDQRVALFRYGTGEAKINYVELLDEQETPINAVEFNQTVIIKIYFQSYTQAQISCNYYVADEKKNPILGADSELAGGALISAVEDGRYIVTYRTRLPLIEGSYSLQTEITVPVIPNTSAKFLDVIDNAIVFNVYRRPKNRLWSKVFIENNIDVMVCQ